MKKLVVKLVVLLVLVTFSFSMVACNTISDKSTGFWLPPEDFLTEEEKEFREQVIETAGLDRNSPDFEEQLARIYAATGSLDYPNYETYKLFVDRLATINKNKQRANTKLVFKTVTSHKLPQFFLVYKICKIKH